MTREQISTPTPIELLILNYGRNVHIFIYDKNNPALLHALSPAVEAVGFDNSYGFRTITHTQQEIKDMLNHPLLATP